MFTAVSTDSMIKLITMVNLFCSSVNVHEVNKISCNREILKCSSSSSLISKKESDTIKCINGYLQGEKNESNSHIDAYCTSYGYDSNL